jgi:hypothetical protein
MGVIMAGVIMAGVIMGVIRAAGIMGVIRPIIRCARAAGAELRSNTATTAVHPVRVVYLIASPLL